MSVRPNYAEGQFYSADQHDLIHLLEENLKKEKGKIDLSLAQKKIIGGVVPHAGHIYSASEAVHFFEIVRKSGQQFDVVIIVNPNHTGKGLPVSIDEHDYWSSSLGKIEIDRQLADRSRLPVDRLSQQYEHSGEVIVPYVQYFLGNKIKFLPVSFGAQSSDNAKVVAQRLWDACKELNRKPLFIASSDFNHFAIPEEGATLDDLALEPLLAKDCKKFESVIHEKEISICGFGAIMSLFYFAQEEYGAFKIKVLKRGHSGEVHQMKEVVDYVSMLFYAE
ncbi:MAG: AmmeMemoRadiSam system protein B [Bacteroidales bacterium]